MFCSHCGKEIADDAVVCIGCGRPVTPKITAKDVGEKWGTGTMVALIIGTLLIPLIGIIFGIIGLNQRAKKNQATALLAIGIFMALISLIIISNS